MKRLLLIDGRPIEALALAQFLESSSLSSAAGEVRLDVTIIKDAEAAAQKVPEDARFDLILIFLDNDSDVGEAITGQLQALPDNHRSTPFVVISGRSGAEDVAAALRCGAHGYIDHSFDCDQFLHTLSLATTGVVVTPLFAICDLVAKPQEDCERSLTARERQVVEHLCAGESNKAIARSLGVTESTVKVHVRRVLKKLGVRNRTQAALLSAPGGLPQSTTRIVPPR